MNSTSPQRRYARYRLPSLDEVFITFSHPEGHGELKRSVFNVSYKGIGFFPEKDDAQIIPVLHAFPARLLLQKDSIEIDIEVIYIRDDIAGCRIHVKNPEEVRKIIRFISPLELARSFKAIDPQIVRQTNAQKPFTWYSGKNNTELIVWRNPQGDLLEFRMVFSLYAIHADVTQGTLQTADINPMELGYLPLYEPWPENLAHWHAHPNRDALQLASEILEYAEPLTAKDREEICSWLLNVSQRN